MKLFRKKTWNENESDSRFKRFCYKSLRILIGSVQGFFKDKGFDKASTLTFYSLLAIIPLLAIGFGIAQELGFAEKFEEQVKMQFGSQPEVANKLVEFSNSTLKTTKGSLVASLGLIFLFWTVLKTIGNIEDFFNEIWKVKSRTLWEEVKSFIPVILLFPIFLVGSSSVILFSSTATIAATEALSFLHFLTPWVSVLFNIIAYLVSWCLISLLLIYLPNTQVSWKAGFKAGIITGIIFFIWQWIYVTFQVKAASYGTIYGSFAAVPLFLIWLNYSWLILMFGAELCYNIQQEQDTGGNSVNISSPDKISHKLPRSKSTIKKI
ncbi:MAG: YihY/virulence factor BrkB family protein [Candidatus Protochlamydia sp.]|nr:YihY/virulence factor BrkB family protein [Candidatus Protochlamydia sp.]